MKIEYDPEKSASNKSKHGIDFEEAKELFNDPNLLEIPAQDIKGEARFLLIGKIRGKHWAAVITYRNKATRIISVRRARQKEVFIYES